MLSSRLSRMAPSRELAICGVTAFVFIVCSLLAVGIPTDAGKTAVVIAKQCVFGSLYRVAVLNIIKPSQYYFRYLPSHSTTQVNTDESQLLRLLRFLI